MAVKLPPIDDLMDAPEPPEAPNNAPPDPGQFQPMNEEQRKEMAAYEKFIYRTPLPNLDNQTPMQNMIQADNEAAAAGMKPHEYAPGMYGRDAEQRWRFSPLGRVFEDSLATRGVGYGYGFFDSEPEYLSREAERSADAPGKPRAHPVLNPEYSKGSGGPFMPTEASGEPTLGGRLGDWLSRLGVSPLIAEQYQKYPVQYVRGEDNRVASSQGWAGENGIGFAPVDTLAEARFSGPGTPIRGKQGQPGRNFQVAMEEAAHQYDRHGRISNTPDFKTAVEQTIAEDPEFSKLLVTTDARTQGAPFQRDYGHVFTALLHRLYNDVAGAIDPDLPSGPTAIPGRLLPFYEPLLQRLMP